MRLVAIDLEGTGSQDGDNEAILEIALVPLADDLKPDMGRAFETLINPGRPIPKRPWISPGLTDAAVKNAPTIEQSEPDIARLVNGAYLVGHNSRVDWSLLHRRLPAIRPAGLLDTLKLARTHRGSKGNGLGALVELYQLTATVNQLVPNGRPHRALWDTVACALLLAHLGIETGNTTRDQLASAAALAVDDISTEPTPPELPTLFE
jgi:DNA polymerase III epsilon subunit-like protein